MIQTRPKLEQSFFVFLFDSQFEPNNVMTGFLQL